MNGKKSLPTFAILKLKRSPNILILLKNLKVIELNFHYFDFDRNIDGINDLIFDTDNYRIEI